MAVKREQIKALASGSLARTVSLLGRGVETAKGVSFRKKPVLRIRIPRNKPIGKVMYTVESGIEPVTFYKRKDAEAFKKLLHVAGYKAGIIRREVTDEGFDVTYGDE